MIRSPTKEQISLEENNNFSNVNTVEFSPVLNTSFSGTTSKASASCTVSTSTTTDFPSNQIPWNQIERFLHMENTAAQTAKQGSTDSGYGVITRRSKVAKGVQTDEVRKRCWRHRRGSLAEKALEENGESLPTRPESVCESSPKSALLSALPSVNFPRWNKINKKDGGVGSLIENYLGGLYTPYGSVRKQLVEQALTLCRDMGQEFFEADYLRPVASVLRAVRDYERNLPPHRQRTHYKKRHARNRKKKPPPGWPLCSRGCLVVHLWDPDPCTLRAGDFYFVATRVGVSLKWKIESGGPVYERSLDAREFSAEMAALVAPDSSNNDSAEDEEDRPEKTSLLVAPEGGISRILVGQLLEELFEGSRRRNRLRCTRDSWVQTEKDNGKVTSPIEESVVDQKVLHTLAPLASEEEFCSDSELKAKPGSVEDRLSNSEPVCQAESNPEVRQVTAIADLDKEVLYSQIAAMPGCRDNCSRSVVYISLTKMQEQNLNAVQLAEILLYFQSIPKRETMCLGFLAIVDGRDAPTPAWCSLHKALALVEESIPGTISLVLALHLQSHKSELLSSRFPIFHVKFESIVNENQLLKYVIKDQLLEEFGGTFQYSHRDWICFHEFLDPFIVSCHQMGCQLVKLIQDLRDGQLPTALTSNLIEQQRKQIMEVLENEQLRYLEEEGAKFLKQLEEYREKFINNPDYEEAVEKSKLLYKQLKKVVQRLEKLANKRLNKLQECMMMKMFEEESSQVLSWLHRKGEETLKKHKTLAESLNAIREQENEFEKFYFLAMRQIERGNDLLEEIPKVKSTEKETGISVTLKRQLDDFTERLEDAREKLEDTSHCYLLLDKTYEWSLETMRFVSHMKVDSTTSINALTIIMKRLESYLQEHPYLEDGVFEEMIQLATKLNNHSLLEQCQIAKSKYEETVELIQARQQTLLRAKERMTFEERPNISESLDNLKIKPCLWNPLLTTSPYRTASQSFLNGFTSVHGSQNLRRESVGSYTSFPSSYYPSPSFRERLMNLSQKKSRTDYLAKRNSLTDEIILGRVNTSDSESTSSRDYRPRKSYPFSSDSLTNLNVHSSKNQLNSHNALSLFSQPHLENDRNWKVCEDELKRYADEVREQNDVLEQQRLAGNLDTPSLRNRSFQESSRPHSTSYTVSNPEEFQKPAPVNSHLTRCASCSDFEELLSTKSSGLESLKLMNNRTLKLIMMEMIQTERDYVKSLGYIIENYVPLLQTSNISQALRSQRNVVFGNIEKIYEFHNCYFLQELEQCESIPYSVGQCFLKYESQFYLYALYNKNKPKSDSLMAEYGNNFFKKKQQELGDKMDLASYLLKPVQRMGKYALLLKQLLKECPETNSEHYNNLKAAEEMVRFQLRHGNDLLAMDALKECDVNIKEQGRLLRQDEFLVGKGKSRKTLRHVFLFEDLIIFSKARRDPNCKGHDYYQYKSSMKTSDLGLTAQVGESPTKFEIWFRKCKAHDILVLQAPSAEVKNAWVEEITGLLWKQAERNRNLRLEEMSSMGIGNKPCMDITPSGDQICDRSISLQQLNKVARFRNSIAVSSTDNFNNNETRRRPLSIGSFGGSSSSSDCHGSSTFYDNTTTSNFYDVTNPLVEVEEAETDKRRSVAQQSQCSAESGIFTDLSTSGDSYVENVQRMKTVERSDSVLSRTSYTSIEAVAADTKEIEISTTISSSSGVEV